MKKFIFAIFVLGLLFFSLQNVLAQKDYVCAVYFTGVGCPHCAETDPIVLEELPREYANFVVIEYEIYQQTENAPLIYRYNEEYNSGLGIPLIIFNKEQSLSGSFSIPQEARETIEGFQLNKCPLIDGSSVDFSDLNLVSLSGFPKIWYQGKILIKVGPGGDSELLKELLVKDDLNEVLKDIEFQEIKPFKIPLSGKYVGFDNGISIGNWIFQWNGPALEVLPSEGETATEETPLAESDLKLTMAKVLSLAAIDAVNPCALAVLTLMLIAILTYNPTKKRNILLAGLAFIVSVFVMYLIYGLIIIKSFQLVQVLTAVRLWLYKILGAGAVILGCLKLKDFFQAKAVCKISPKVDKVIARITSPKGAFAVGAFVTIFLLPCTIGPYIICGGILCPLGLLKALPWLLFYNLIFVLPMLAVVLIIYLGLSRVENISSWQVRNIRYLNLISGLIVLGLGIAMILGLV